MPSKPKKEYYYAVRQGRGVRNCNFLTVTDFREHTVGADSGTYKYRICDTLQEAADYIRPPPVVVVTTPVAATAQQKKKAATAGNPQTRNTRKAAPAAKKVPTPTSPAKKVAATSPTTTASVVAASVTVVPAAASLPAKRKDPAAPVVVVAYKKARTDAPAPAVEHSPYLKSRLRRPTKKWEGFFKKLKEYRNEEDGTLDCVRAGIEDDTLHKWIVTQNQEYKAFREGRTTNNTMFDEKITRLQSIGFVFDVEGKANRRTIHKTWMENLGKLKQYIDEHDGSTEIEGEENAKIKPWLLDQRYEWRKLQRGKPSMMTLEKIARLNEIGVEFEKVRLWDEQMVQLLAFKEKHGHVNVPSIEGDLGKWINAMRRQCKALLEGKNPTDVTQERFEELKALGLEVIPAIARLKMSADDYGKEFDRMIGPMKEYKAQHGDCIVKRNDPDNRQLFSWVLRQRAEYKKLKEKNSSRLTVQQLMELTNLGFAFVLKEGGYRSFDERMEQLKAYKAEHGHVKVPTQHEELGHFVMRQRKLYRLLKTGKPSAMTDQKIKALEEVRFDWGTNKWKDRSTWRDPVSWDGRFQELLAFKAEHGHTIVPQHTLGLGRWVNRQRLH
jgi:hypothetical protein